MTDEYTPAPYWDVRDKDNYKRACRCDQFREALQHIADLELSDADLAPGIAYRALKEKADFRP